jgi:hypothetical protein
MLSRDELILRYRAHGAVRRAVKRGQLKRPAACERCGVVPIPSSDGRAVIHAHHYLGYDHPLCVQWLCPNCHIIFDPRVTGPKHGSSILNESAVRAIRGIKGKTDMLAAQFGVHRTTIQRVRRMETWRATAPLLGGSNPR